jgi:hypothetical protein
MSAKDAELKKIACPSCGGELRRASRYDSEEEENIPFAKCASCGTEYDQHSQEYYELYADMFTSDIESSVFKLGIKGSIDGIEYEIIGRIRYQEEDEYELAYWDEWLAVNSEGNYYWFVEENGELFMFSEIVPDEIDMESDSDVIRFNGKRIQKDDGYVARIVYAEGELSWKPEIGEPTTVYDYQSGGTYYTIEHSEDEVSVSAGKPLSYKKALNAFRKDEFKDAYDRTAKKRKGYMKTAVVFLSMSIVSFIFMARGCMSGDEIKGVAQTRVVLSENEPVSEEGISAFTSSMLYGPVTLTSSEPTYRVTVGVDTSVQDLNQEWETVSAVLVREDRLATLGDGMKDKKKLRDFLDESENSFEPLESYTFMADFWDEQGYDDEGAWRENDTSVDKDFILDDPGNYYVYLTVTSQNRRSVDSIVISMQKGIRGFGAYVFAFLLFAGLAVWMFHKSKTYNELPFPFKED